MMDAFHFKGDRLFCEDVLLSDLADRLGTPLYVYSKRSVNDHCRWIEEAFGTLDHLSCYAIKANANREILHILAQRGIGADAGSIGEIRIALAAGFPAEKITFGGVGKRDDEIEFALRQGIKSLNVESDEEIRIIENIASRLGVTARILARVNFDIRPETHPYITTGQRQNKFGIDRSDAIDVMQRAAKLPHIEVLGVHSHIGSQITRGETFVAAARALLDFVGEARRAGLQIKEVNFGGGFGVQYRDYISHPSLSSEPGNPEENLTTVGMLQAVLPILQQAHCTILIQPGRSIVAHAGVLLTKVLYRKTAGGRTFIILDAGMNDLIRPSLYQSYHQIVPLSCMGGNVETVDVVGPLCETGDFFARDRKLPAVNRGEYCAIMCTGAYGYVLSSNYNGRPRPAEVLVDREKSLIIRDRERLTELYGMHS